MILQELKYFVIFIIPSKNFIAAWGGFILEFLALRGMVCQKARIGEFGEFHLNSYRFFLSLNLAHYL